MYCVCHSGCDIKGSQLFPTNAWDIGDKLTKIVGFGVRLSTYKSQLNVCDDVWIFKRFLEAKYCEERHERCIIQQIDEMAMHYITSFYDTELLHHGKGPTLINCTLFYIDPQVPYTLAQNCSTVFLVHMIEWEGLLQSVNLKRSPSFLHHKNTPHPW